MFLSFDVSLKKLPIKLMRSAAVFFALALGETCSRAAPTIEATTYNGVAAFRLSDGKIEAVVVPDFSGRVMRFGAVGGANWLWNAAPEDLAADGYKNWGGDKTFVGPHDGWKYVAPGGSLWPPQPAWDGMAFSSVVPTHPAEGDILLSVLGREWQGFNLKITRGFGFTLDGRFFVRQTIERPFAREADGKRLASTVPASIWSVSQAAPPDAVWLPRNPDSIYQNGFRRWGKLPQNALVETVAPKLLRVVPRSGRGYKIGTDARVSAIAAQKGRELWLQRAAFPAGDYPDGGLPVEFYSHGAAGTGGYVELELLSPLRAFQPNTKWTHTVFWSLHELSSNDVSSTAVQSEIEQLLHQ